MFIFQELKFYFYVLIIPSNLLVMLSVPKIIYKLLSYDLLSYR